VQVDVVQSVAVHGVQSFTGYLLRA
jgi:hypothetical protein